MTASEWQSFIPGAGGLHLFLVPPVFTLEDLFILEDRIRPSLWQDDVENALWLDILHPFAAVKNLCPISRVPCKSFPVEVSGRDRKGSSWSVISYLPFTFEFLFR